MIMGSQKCFCKLFSAGFAQEEQGVMDACPSRRFGLSVCKKIIHFDYFFVIFLIFEFRRFIEGFIRPFWNVFFFSLEAS